MNTLKFTHICILIWVIVATSSGKPQDRNETLAPPANDSVVTIPDIPPPQVAMTPQFPACTAFPGSMAWNQCWNTFNARMDQFQQQMIAYGNAMRAWESSFPGEGPISTSEINGIKIRSRGLQHVNTNSFNEKVYVDIYIGEEDDMNVIKSGNTLQFNLMHDGKLRHWITVTPPSNVDVNKFRYHRDEDMLHIWFKANGPKPSFSRSASSFSQSYSPFYSPMYPHFR